MIGGSVSHEYMLLTDAGEDSIVLCDECGYSANMEAADTIADNSGLAPSGELMKVHTHDCKTIEDVCNFLNSKLKNHARQ